MTLLVTGATGFIGKAFSAQMLALGWQVRGTVRKASEAERLLPNVIPVTTDSIGPDTDWTSSLRGVDTVVHLAARVHVLQESSPDPYAEFRRVNVLGIERLARAAVEAGVRRIVFVSSIGVNGDRTTGQPFIETDEPRPSTPYAVSKLEAEEVLQRISVETGLEVVVIRPPLVYGPDNPGNFQVLLRFVARRLPLPLASVHNRRSFIYVRNLTDALAVCVTHPAAAGQTYLVSDGEDVSTPELIIRTASALGVEARLLTFPESLMRLAGILVGKNATVNRLLSSLTIDSSKIKGELGWKPPFTMEEGLRDTAEWFKATTAVKSV